MLRIKNVSTSSACSATVHSDTHIPVKVSFPSESIISWFNSHRRSLPWRAENVSAWAVMVSEFMLQQTPVTRVLPVWHRWMARWPQPVDLANEPESEAIKEWGRLGYPRRALRLHQSARYITQHYDGKVPENIHDLRQLPGVGQYTAAAIANFAFHQLVPVVDVNVRRVIHRVISGRDPYKPSVHDWVLFSQIIATTQNCPQALAAAVMEFGALCCTARAPHCDICPIAMHCLWLAHGKPEPEVKSVGQKYHGTDRYVRGLLLALLRDHDHDTLAKSSFDSVWPDDVQRERAFASLLSDGLISKIDDGYQLGSSPQF